MNDLRTSIGQRHSVRADLVGAPERMESAFAVRGEVAESAHWNHFGNEPAGQGVQP